MLAHQNLNLGTIIKCRRCGKESPPISQALGLCVDCIRQDFDQVLPLIKEAHTQSRKSFALPNQPPQDKAGIVCRLCINECHIPREGTSYCGLRTNKEGRLKGVSADKANLSWYYDPLPTNCVADWVCPRGTGAGYPDFAYRPGPEYGYKNLYFGGDPTPQLPHALRVSRLALERNRDRNLRICWETNGSMHPTLLRQMAEISLGSGGCIKFDLKAWSEELHLALCGVSNKRTLGNFQFLADYISKRPSPPFLIASTLLVPGYVDKEEVSKIASFIASLSPDIPYVLLAFYPQFMMNNLPTTSRRHAEECLEAAKGQDLKKVRVGNLHLLRSEDYL